MVAVVIIFCTVPYKKISHIGFEMNSSPRQSLKISMKHLLYSLLCVSILLPSLSIGEERPMEPPPDERAEYQYKRDPGQLKRTNLGFLDPTPDVVSLSVLPRDDYGFVDWSKAISIGIISPRDSITNTEAPAEPVQIPPDVLIKSKLDFMPDVIFPHSSHMMWLKCSICHPKIFEEKAGATPISMIGIWKGQFCGRCHDRVAFPIRNCFRCHSAPRSRK